tara:strand:- start:78 stop:1181 length:1104 start_codon:yes stop_codon:yes gene_type:complete
MADCNYSNSLTQTKLDRLSQDEKRAICALGDFSQNIDREQAKDVLFEIKSLERLGSAHAPYVLGQLYIKGWLVDKSYEQGLTHLFTAIKRGSKDAKLYAAKLLFDSEDEEHWEYSYRLFIELSLDGVVDAIYGLGLFYENGKYVNKNIEKAISYYSKAAKLGFVDAHTALGYWYGFGDDEVKNVRQAKKHLEVAVSRHHAEAKALLGRLLLANQPSDVELLRAYSLLLAAAEHGEASAMCDIAKAYYRGHWNDLVSENDAYTYMLKASNMDYYECVHALAYHHFNGHNYQKSFELFEIAAKRGEFAKSWFALSMFHFNGVVVQQDYDIGMEYLNKAARLGDSDAIEVIKKLGSGESRSKKRAPHLNN